MRAHRMTPLFKLQSEEKFVMTYAPISASVLVNLYGQVFVCGEWLKYLQSFICVYTLRSSISHTHQIKGYGHFFSQWKHVYNCRGCYILTKNRWGHFNFMNSRFHLHEFSISISQVHDFNWFQLHEFTISTSWSWNREFVKLKSWIREVVIVNSRSWIREVEIVNS
jgi:hypothetical protein